MGTLARYGLILAIVAGDYFADIFDLSFFQLPVAITNSISIFIEYFMQFNNIVPIYDVLNAISIILFLNVCIAWLYVGRWVIGD